MNEAQGRGLYELIAKRTELINESARLTSAIDKTNHALAYSTRKFTARELTSITKATKILEDKLSQVRTELYNL
jgi:hypothetical protein